MMVELESSGNVVEGQVLFGSRGERSIAIVWVDDEGDDWSKFE